MTMTSTLFKRDEQGGTLHPGSPGYDSADFCIRFMIKGKRHFRKLGTADKREAKRRAALRYSEIVAEVSKDDFADLSKTKLRQASAVTIPELLDAYQKAPTLEEAEAGETGAPGKAVEKTRTQNANGLKQLVSRAGHDPEGTASVIDDKIVIDWYKKAEAKASALRNMGKQSKAASCQRSANSRCTQAASLFTPRLLEYYKELGLYLPGFAAFHAARKTFRIVRIPRVDYRPPTDEIILPTLAEWEALEHRNTFITIGMELSFGLRAGEVGQTKWGWISEQFGYPVCAAVAKEGDDAEACVKNGTGMLLVRAVDPWFTIMMNKVRARGWLGQPNDYLIEGSMTVRTDTNFRAVSALMRHLGWKTRLTNHALRAYVGGQITMRYGVQNAQVWLRHASLNTTQSNYGHFAQGLRPDNLDSITAVWATSQAAPTLTIVQKAASN